MIPLVGTSFKKHGSFVFHPLISMSAHCTVSPPLVISSNSPAGVRSSHAKLLDRKELPGVNISGKFDSHTKPLWRREILHVLLVCWQLLS